MYPTQICPHRILYRVNQQGHGSIVGRLSQIATHWHATAVTHGGNIPCLGIPRFEVEAAEHSQLYPRTAGDIDLFPFESAISASRVLAVLQAHVIPCVAESQPRGVSPAGGAANTPPAGPD